MGFTRLGAWLSSIFHSTVCGMVGSWALEWWLALFGTSSFLSLLLFSAVVPLFLPRPCYPPAVFIVILVANCYFFSGCSPICVSIIFSEQRGALPAAHCEHTRSPIQVTFAHKMVRPNACLLTYPDASCSLELSHCCV